VNTIIDIEITSTYTDDRKGVATEGRSHLEVRITSSVEFKKPTRYLLGFRLIQPEKIKLRDEKYTTICGLDPFEHLRALIPPFEIIFDNLGDAQLGCYIRLPVPPGDPASYCMEIREKDRQTKKIDEIVEVWESKKLLIVRAVMRPSQKIYIEELKGDL